MSVLGIDLGTHATTISVVRAGTIDIVLNEASNRKTPSVVGFGEKQREIGESGYTSYARNVQNTISGFKRLLGRNFNDPVVQKDLHRHGGAKWVQMDDKSIGAEVRLMNQRQTFSMQQVTAMFLVKIKEISQSYLKQPLLDVVLSVPGYWTDSQRMALLDACKIAGMAPLQLINSLTAVCFYYGFYKPEITDENARKVMFIDAGASDFSVCVAEFSKNKCQILSTAYEPTVGGYNLDELLAEHFAANFLKKTKLDIKQNKKAWMRVLQAVEKVKKTLNENPSATISVECLLEDRDLSDSITKDDYLKLIAESGITQKVLVPIQKVLEESGVKKEELHSIEWLGSAMRAAPLQLAITEFLGRQMLSTTNAEEATAKGCALRCAFLSPGRKTRPYELVDKLTHAVTLAWKSLGDPTDTQEITTPLFPKGQVYGKSKYITFPRKDAKPFELYTRYTDPASVPVVDTATVFATGKVPTINKEADPTTGKKDANVRVKIRLDAQGVVRIGEAELIEEKDVVVEVPIEEKKEEAKDEKKEGAAPMETEPVTPSSPSEEKKDKEGDVPMKDSDKPKTRTETRKKTTHTQIPIQVFYNSLTNDVLEKNTKLEAELQKKDYESAARAQAKNAVESTVYSSRDRLEERWRLFVTEAEKEKISQLLEKVEQWLYDEGDDESKEAYDSKLAEITSLTTPLAKRAFEWEALPPAVAALQQSIASFRAATSSGEEKYAHLTKEDFDKVLKECQSAEDVIASKLEAFKNRKPTEDPVFFSADITHRSQNLSANCGAILSKPKPAPPKPEPTPAPQPTPSEAPKGEKMDTTEPGSTATPEATPAGEKMDTTV